MGKNRIFGGAGRRGAAFTQTKTVTARPKRQPTLREKIREIAVRGLDFDQSLKLASFEATLSALERARLPKKTVEKAQRLSLGHLEVLWLKNNYTWKFKHDRPDAAKVKRFFTNFRSVIAARLKAEKKRAPFLSPRGRKLAKIMDHITRVDLPALERLSPNAMPAKGVNWKLMDIAEGLYEQELKLLLTPKQFKLLEKVRRRAQGLVIKEMETAEKEARRGI